MAVVAHHVMGEGDVLAFALTFTITAVGASVLNVVEH